MDAVDQAFWQLFHAVAAKIAGTDVIDALPTSLSGDNSVVIELPAPAHAVSVLRREAERRGILYPDLIATLSEERQSDLPDWWLEIARSRDVGALPAEAMTGGQ
jgi:hypothetical protein